VAESNGAGGDGLAALLDTANAEANGLQEGEHLVLKAAEDFEGVLVGVVHLFTGGFCGFAQVCGGGGIGIGDSVAGALFGIAQHMVTAFLGFADEGCLIEPAGAFFVGSLDDLAGGVVGVGNDAVPCFEDLGCLAEIGGDGKPHLVDHIKDAFPIHNQVAANGQSAGLDHELFESIN
jgi:hypothetical protein